MSPKKIGIILFAFGLYLQLSNKFKNEEETRSSLLKNKNWDWTIILYQGKTFSTTKKLLFFCTFETENISLKHTLDFDNFKGNSLLKRDFYYFLCWILSFIKKYRVLFKSNSASIWQFFVENFPNKTSVIQNMRNEDHQIGLKKCFVTEVG